MAKLVSYIHPKAGFHPTSTTKIILDDREPLTKAQCSLHLYYELPTLIFVDPYELALYEESYAFRHWGNSNLELPISALPKTSSSVLLDVKIPKSATEFEVKLPLHLRYGDPTQGALSSGHHTEELPWPTGFLECPLSASTRIPKSSLPRMPTEVSSLFNTSSATLIPVSYIGTNYSESISVPTGNPADLTYVEAGTALTILLAFIILFCATLRTANRVALSSRSKTD